MRILYAVRTECSNDTVSESWPINTFGDAVFIHLTYRYAFPLSSVPQLPLTTTDKSDVGSIPQADQIRFI